MTSDVAEFFRDQNVFVTGATGFLGVSLIEKILRCCPDVKNIFMLIRPKKGKTALDRLPEIIKNSVFNRIKEDNKVDVFKKLVPIAGDVGEDFLGLSAEDKQTLIDKVNIVYHCAATLDFEANLKTASNINLLGTRRVVQIAQKLKNLKAFVHVSSAYVNATLQEVYEKIYPAPADVKEVLQNVDELTEKELEKATPSIIGDHPNPYTFTKHLAEHEVANSYLPTVIIRPSMSIKIVNVFF